MLLERGYGSRSPQTRRAPPAISATAPSAQFTSPLGASKREAPEDECHERYGRGDEGRNITPLETVVGSEFREPNNT